MTPTDIQRTLAVSALAAVCLLPITRARADVVTDWNVTARMNTPYVKKFTEERELTVMLLVDVSASGTFGSIELSKRELAAEVAAILAFSAINNRDKVGLLLFSEEVELFIAPKKGRLHTFRLIREMLYFQPRGRVRGPPGPRPLSYLNKLISRRAVVFVISDFLAPDYSKPLTVTSRRHDLVAMPVIDPGEERLPNVGLITFEDAETGEQVEINTSSSGIREAFAAEEKRRRKNLDKLFGSRGVDVVPLATDEDYPIPLRAFFERRERRAAA
jgi:uncharacterized protein (DUF58 family)